MMPIIRGNDYQFDLSLADADGDYELSGSSFALTVYRVGGTVVLTQYLTVDQFGVTTLSDGLAVGPDGPSAGVIVQTLTAVQTTALPLAPLYWELVVTDSLGLVSTAMREQWVIQSNSYVTSGLDRRTLRRRIAGRMGDLVVMTATAASASTSTFVDALTVNIIAENLDGRMIVVANGANAGHVARIQSKDNATSTITFTPPAPTTFSQGNEIEVLNAHSRGFLVDEYNRAINDAINDAWPRFKLDYTYTLPSDFDSTNPSITVPDEMAYVYEVQWQNSDDNWIPLRKSKWYGWRANPALGTITVLSDPAPMINGKPVRLFGYGRHPELSADADLCAVPAEWLVARACYHLSLGGIDKENAKANAVLTFAREADMLFRRIVTPPHPSMERVH